MAERPDLRQISSNITEALAECDADTLRDILTFVFKEYVVEGPPPFLVHQTERIEDLEGLSFAEVITALQTRLDLPELGLLVVEGARVSVRVGGQSHVLVADAGPPQPLPAASAPAVRPQPGVRIEEVELPRRAPVQDQSRQAAGVPRAAAGLSVRGRPAGDMAGVESRPTAAPSPSVRPPAGQPGEAGQPADEAPAAPPAAPDKPSSPDEDDASTRFSLLELD